MTPQVYTYADLRKQIHDDLRIQHPEWVQPNGESPMCDSYEACLLELLQVITQRQPSKFPLTRQRPIRGRLTTVHSATSHVHLAGCEGAGRTP